MGSGGLAAAAPGAGAHARDLHAGQVPHAGQVSGTLAVAMEQLSAANQSRHEHIVGTDCTAAPAAALQPHCSHSRQGLVAVAVVAVVAVVVPLLVVLTVPSGCKRPAQLWWKEL